MQTIVNGGFELLIFVRLTAHHDELSLSLGWFSVEVPGSSQGRWRPPVSRRCTRLGSRSSRGSEHVADYSRPDCKTRRLFSAQWLSCELFKRLATDSGLGTTRVTTTPAYVRVDNVAPLSAMWREPGCCSAQWTVMSDAPRSIRDRSSIFF